ncbi:MAG: hypothetical protein HN645_05850 [Gemmatimonadales bacterium]|nr:hypothetical protein [Gemmatimonadales bacterium]
MSLKRLFVLFAAIAATAPAAAAQQVPWSPSNRGSDNIEVLGHLPLGHRLSVADMDLEQEMDRPYAYVSRMVYGFDGPKGTDIISLADPENPVLLYEWRIENQDLHQRTGGMDVKHFKWNDRYYLVQSLQFGGGPDNDLGAVILDVTGLPDPSTVREVARIREPEMPGGFHNIFIYKHSNDRVYLFTTARAPGALVYDLGMIVDGDLENARVGMVPVPESSAGSGDSRGYHDFYVGYHPDTGEDRFYGGGTGGYYIYDVSVVTNPELRITLTGVSGVTYGHTFTPSPDGRYVIAETEYQYAPLRIFDLQPALEGEVTNIRSPISAFTADWQNLVHNHEVRWPYVFVSGYLDGLQIFNLQDPVNPVSSGYYDTYIGPKNPIRSAMFNGAFGIDVRNEDGLIVISDMSTGLWTFKMDGFQGWNGEHWGMPNISSAQDWDNPVVKRPISD